MNFQHQKKFNLSHSNMVIYVKCTLYVAYLEYNTNTI